MITKEQIESVADEYVYHSEKVAFKDGAEWAIGQMQEENDRLRKALQVIVVEMDRIVTPARNISDMAKKALE